MKAKICYHRMKANGKTTHYAGILMGDRFDDLEMYDEYLTRSWLTIGEVKRQVDKVCKMFEITEKIHD